MATISTWVEKARKKFRARYRGADGKPHDIWPLSRFDNRSEAKTALKHWESTQLMAAMGRSDVTTPVLSLFERWLIECAAGTANKRGKIIKPSTLVTFRSSLAYVTTHIQQIKELNATWVKNYKIELSLRYEPWTVHRRLVDLKSFCSWLRREKLIHWDPFESTVINHPQGEPRFYSDEEIAALETGATASGDLHVVLYLRLGYFCGFRHGESANLSVESVRRHPELAGWGQITLFQQDVKNEKSRVVPAPPEVIDILMQLCATRRSGPVFNGWREKHFLYAWARTLAGAGIKPAPWYVSRYAWARGKGLQDRGEAPYHGLRHTFCRRFLENGGDIAELKELTGHRSLKILIDTYSHFAHRHIAKRSHEVYERMRAKLAIGGQLGGKLTEIIENNGDTVKQGVTHYQRISGTGNASK